MSETETEDVAMDVKVELKKTGNIYSIDAGVEDLVVIQIRANDHPVGVSITRQLLSTLVDQFDAWIAQIDEAVTEAQQDEEDEEPEDG